MSAPRPRVSEHTDAARLEALRDSMRPRVEGEAVTEARVRAIRAALWEGIGYAVNVTDRDVDDLAADWLRLTAEVARLRELLAIAGIANADDAGKYHEAECRYKAEAKQLAAENNRLTGKAVGLIDRLGSIPFRQSDDIPEGAVYVNAAWWKAFSNPPSVEDIEAQVASLKMVPLALPTTAPEATDG